MQPVFSTVVLNFMRNWATCTLISDTGRYG